MLTKRTNILFDDELWELVTSVAKRENSSVGKVVRKAIRNTYSEDEISKRRADACKKILAIRPKPFPGKIDYKELINYGRKY
ncbi:MAG: hypothetical protein US60_C0010G0008 [Microgenomates group bacterium GW2011_GWC1_37_8]|uniref:Ribbon-helix-helix protein CopG domain-containing protein n=1 Tax=Candidatus Woesebacteria bacterium GW2011_GWB1_38_8 TaxID=1618570 RepID=A0A0G0KZ86_9BACT|nr:MAG: hypothetical protein US60_C0010G0008 [Microgenomates group bacterium GW2011_GWC1_37_8]KKQ84998.1 MAG: hypothetical protein UT08_C0011G0016 [Candidatus Woesebacteria bacterium GW2011_GWB1_38_8]